MDCEPGDIFDWDDRRRSEPYYVNKYGVGPFRVLRVYPENKNSLSKVDLVDVVTRKLHTWSHPSHWGKRNEFLTAAYKANNNA